MQLRSVKPPTPYLLHIHVQLRHQETCNSFRLYTMSQGLSSRKRTRDLFFRRPTKPSNPATAPQAGSALPSQAAPNSSLPSRAHASAQPGQAFLDKALLALTPRERATIEENLLSSSREIHTAVEDAYRAALSQKQVCEDKRWRWSFRGRNVVLRDEADKVLAWLDKFKTIGDIVANVDPVHIGLPWAGIRTILEV